MSEKKYYVFLSPLNNGNKPFFQLVSFGFMAELFGFAKCNTKIKIPELTKFELYVLGLNFILKI